MKKLLIIALLLSCSASVFAFTNREHCAVAIIAEKYLTPSAKAAVNEIFKGEKLSMYASYPDEYRAVLLVDGEKVPHTFPVDADYNLTGDYTTSAVYAIEWNIKALKNLKKYSDKENLQHLATLVHLMGDIHCPSHVKYSKEFPKTVKAYIYASKPIKFHSAWDSGFLSKAYSGGIQDLVYLADIATPEQRAEYQKGDIFDWASDNAKFCMEFTHDLDVSESREIEIDRPYVTEHAAKAKIQIMKAGYRLAKVLNDLF